MRRCNICGNFYHETKEQDNQFICNKDENNNPKPITFVVVCPHCLQGASVVGADVDYNSEYTGVDGYCYLMFSSDFNPKHDKDYPIVIGEGTNNWERLEIHLSGDLTERLEVWKDKRTDNTEFRQFFINKDGRYIFCGANDIQKIERFGQHTKETWIESWRQSTDFEKIKRGEKPFFNKN